MLLLLVAAVVRVTEGRHAPECAPCRSVEEAGDPPDHQRRFFGVPAGSPDVIALTQLLCPLAVQSGCGGFVFCGALAEGAHGRPSRLGGVGTRRAPARRETGTEPKYPSARRIFFAGP